MPMVRKSHAKWDNKYTRKEASNSNHLQGHNKESTGEALEKKNVVEHAEQSDKLIRETPRRSVIELRPMIYSSFDCFSAESYPALHRSVNEK